MVLGVDCVDHPAVDEDVQSRIQGSGPVEQEAGKDHDNHVDDDVELTIVHARLLADHDAQDIQATG